MQALIAQASQFAQAPPETIRLARAPYRVCPLGAHVDHQNGRVLGLALDTGVHVVFAPRADRRIRLRSLDFPGDIEFHIDQAQTMRDGWACYAAGAADALEKHTKQPLARGLTAIIQGTLPIGGLSSSAAVTLAYLLALEAVNDIQADPWDNIMLEQDVENRHIGLNNGILDQSVIALSQQGHLLSLDCARHDWELIPAGPGAEYRVAVAYSGHGGALKNTNYNQRVEECQEAARQLLEQARIDPPDPTTPPVLRDVPPEIFETHEKQLPPMLARRARHFFTENERVTLGARAWAQGDLERLGQLVNASGASSVENYECGCPELITLYEILRDTPGVYGARFSGGGFRGSCVALYRPGAETAIRDAIDNAYPQAHPKLAGKYKLNFQHSGDGASIL